MSDVPNTPTFFIEQEIHEQLTLYKVANSGVITAIATGSSCKLLVNDFESERHPDLSVYKTLPRNGGRKVWRRWKPHVAIEVVSRISRKRDYGEKREEYLALGIREYWIIDPLRKVMLALRRQRGQWREMKLTASDIYQTPLLPGFKLDLAKVFAAGEAGR